MTTGPQNAVPFGKYLLLKRLATGGMAELYLAKEPAEDRLVVIKRILPYLAEETEFVRMFLDEARIASQLHHPHIIQMYELGRLDGSIFIAMEFVDGVDLRKILQQEQKRLAVVPPDIAAWLTSRLCEGLQYAHNKAGGDGRPLGIIHRDVSPQNLMIGYSGQVKLVDFGIAKATSFMERSKPGVIKGKFLYLSPEQLTQDRIDHRADIFAIGTMLYEVTTGKSPFYKPTAEAVIYAIRAEDPPPPHLTHDGFPVELSRIIMRCLLKDRSRRYQQAGEVHADLEAWLESEAPTSLATVVDYVGKLFGDQEERTSIFIPPNALSQFNQHERGPSSDEEPPQVRARLNPTVPDAPITDEPTTPITAGVGDRAKTSEGRRPTPASGELRRIDLPEERRAQPSRPGESTRPSGKGTPTSNSENRLSSERKQRPYPPGGFENTGNTEPLPLLGPAPASIDPASIGELVVNPTTRPEGIKRSRDVPPPDDRGKPPVPSPRVWSDPKKVIAEPVGPSETFADALDARSTSDRDDEESTIDRRASAHLMRSAVMKYRFIFGHDGLLTRKPWLIAVFAFLSVLLVGLLLILWVRPDRPPMTRATGTHVNIDPATGDPLPEEAASDLGDSGKTVVKFFAPSGTIIIHDGRSYLPNKPYALVAGSFALTYRCPKKGKVTPLTITVEHNRPDPQLVPINCR